MSEDTSLPVPADENETAVAPDFYTELAATLHAIADDVATLAGRDLPAHWHFGIDMLPLPHEMDDDDKAAAIDAVGVALVGKAGAPEPMSGGTWHHNVKGRRGPVAIAAYSRVGSPEERAQRAEAERLRAELEEMRAERDRLAAQQRDGEPGPSDGETGQ